MKNGVLVFKSLFSFSRTLISTAPSDSKDDDNSVDWVRAIPFIGLHLMVLLVFWVGFSPIALFTAIGLYLVRMFAITAFYHRMLGHRAFKAPAWVGFMGSMVANASAQRGPLWWAAHHRLHHRHSDHAEDIHSPSQRGILHAHTLWFLTRGARRTRHEVIPDLQKAWGLGFLDRNELVAPALLAVVTVAWGALCQAWWPSLGTGPLQMFVWGFVISTVALFHGTFSVNSLNHMFGSRPFATKDDSRNNLLVALFTLGEGWHNNHHHYPGSVRQGFHWWQIDVTWYGLRFLGLLGLAHDFRPIPKRVIEEIRR